MAFKRTREEFELERTIAMANYFILLSKTSNSAYTRPTNTARVYECKTCNRQFPSFQALGGHRASHKKPKSSDTMIDHHDRTTEGFIAKKPKTHECSICGLEFPIGQALGGHMRRHRAALMTGSSHLPTLSLSLDTSSSHDYAEESISETKKSRSIISSDDHDHDHKRVVCLDLNLTPMENGLLEFGKIAPVVC